MAVLVSTDTNESMGIPVTPHARNPLTPNFKQLSFGIDSIDLGIYVLWNYRWNETLRRLEAMKQEAQFTDGILNRSSHERPYLHLPNGKRPHYRYHLQYPEYHLYLAISEEAGNTPNAYLSVNSEALWKLGLPLVLEFLEIDLFHLGGTVEKIQPSRIDLCADYLIPCGLTLDFLESHRVSRAKETSHYLRNGILESYYVGSPSAPVRLRQYDKGKEIIAKGIKFWFAEIWGIDTINDVWRTEFQLRRLFLKQCGINSLDDLNSKIVGIWAYLTDEWVAFRYPDNNRTARRTVLPWWKNVQHAWDNFGGYEEVRRFSKESQLASIDWYIAHIAGCLPSVAARLNITSQEEAVKALSDNVTGYWKQKDFDAELEKRYIKLGHMCEGQGEGCDA